MRKKEIKYLVISDIHLGHNINKTEYITENLRAFFLQNAKVLKDLDIIFIAGDIYDRLLTPSSTDYIESSRWLMELIMFCKTYNIKLRVLEGTPSHDWKQAKLISSIIEKLEITIDYKYIETLHIEDMSDLGLTVLYIPDEYKHNSENTLKDVKKLMKELKLKEVDIAIMHGAFKYQIPFDLESNHNEEEYLRLVKYYISIGHVHTSTVKDRILAQGSFDRLKHNEEEDKGCMLITLRSNGDNSFLFLNNKKAMKFITLDYSNKSIEDILKDVKTKVSKLPVNSNVRLLTDNHKELAKSLTSIKESYPGLRFKVESSSSNKKDNKLKLLTKEIVNDSFSITKENISELMKEEMSKHSLSSREEAIFLEELKSII